MKALTWAITLIAGGALLTGSAAAQCTRHFYNNSNYPFVVSMNGTGLCNGLPICTVKPHTTSTFTYLLDPAGSMVVAPGGVFGVTGCYIIHHGNTGPWVAVNDPANGDVATCGGQSWPCPGPPPRRSRKRG